MLCSDKSVQTGECLTNGECWIVDTDSTVVKYCDDNIVTITVPGHAAHGDGKDDIETLAIVAHNTLRLRIVPGKDFDHYQEIPDDDDEYYDYCMDEQTPPPLPPREDKFHQNTFKMGRKSFLQKLGVNTSLDSDGRGKLQTIEEDQKFKKDLKKYLGRSNDDWSEIESIEGHFKKDLSKFLGIKKHTLEKVMTTQSYKTVPYKMSSDNKLRSKLEIPYLETVSEEGSEGYSSIDLSSSSNGSCKTSLDLLFM